MFENLKTLDGFIALQFAIVFVVVVAAVATKYAVGAL